MKFRIQVLTTVIFVLFFSHTFAQRSRLVKIWETDSTLKVPESVLYYAPENVLYVSCIDGKPTEKDLKGSIAKVSPDGKIINAEWAINLNAPKGMGIHNGKLYVSDLSEIAIIELASGKITQRVPVPGAIFLNDITIDASGIVYVSDSQTGKIHQLKNGAVSLWLDKKPGVNGLLAVNKTLYLAVKDTLYKADSRKKLSVVTTGLDESSDGIVDTGSEIIVSCWNGIIYAIKPDGTKTELLDTRAQKSNTADIGFDPKSKTLYVPTFFRNKVVAYKIE